MKTNDVLASEYMARSSDYRAIFGTMWLSVHKSGSEITPDDSRAYVDFFKANGIEKWNQARLLSEISDLAMNGNQNGMQGACYPNWRSVANACAERGVSRENLGRAFDAIHDRALSEVQASGLSSKCAQYLTDSEQDEILSAERECADDVRDDAFSY